MATVLLSPTPLPSRALPGIRPSMAQSGWLAVHVSVGWVGRAGQPLVADGDGWRCPATGQRYEEIDAWLARPPVERPSWS